MKQLSETWFADGYIDFELKKYTLLAYLQEVNRYFNQNKLYPQLSDVIFHYNNLLSFKKNKKFLQDHFPKRLSGIQMEKLQLLYQQMIEDDEMMKELETIIQYAEATIKPTLKNGAEIYELIEDSLIIAPVGLIPLENNEGYFFLAEGKTRQTRVYEYRLSIFEKHDEKYRSIRTQFVADWQRSFVNTYENIKASLIKERNHLPNPAVFSIETNLQYPVEESLLPIAKRSLVRFISTNAA
jgi:hypothetical protein